MPIKPEKGPPRWGIRLAVILSLRLLAVGLPTYGVELVLSPREGRAGYVEISGVEAGDFDPQMWKIGVLNLIPDVRFPLLTPIEGKFRNIYAPSAVETGLGYRLFYGGWDGSLTGNDRIYSILTDPNFARLAGRSQIAIAPAFEHVCNVNAIKLGNAFAAVATVFPIQGLNKPCFLLSDQSGTNWNRTVGEPYRIQNEDILAVEGYEYEKADINGMNVLVHETSRYRLYFGDFAKQGQIFCASSRDGRKYKFEQQVYSGPGLLNDLKVFDSAPGRTYLMGLHENGSRLWQAVAADGLRFSPAKVLFTNLNSADQYIVALGWVTRSSRKNGSGKIIGVLYGAGAAPSLDANRIYARWLQKKIVFVSESGERWEGSRSDGPDKQLIAFDQGTKRGRFEVFNEDGITRIGWTAWQTVCDRQRYELQIRVSRAGDR